jgi:hypothetical protein
MPVNPKILDLWERELKLRTRLDEAAFIKAEITPLISGHTGVATVFREKMQFREQQLLREIQSAVAHRERLEEEEDRFD